MTGVPSVTLRAWERRYGFLKPLRTDAGHRFYNEEQIALIKKATYLIESGMAVSRVSDLLAAEQQRSREVGHDWQAIQREMLEAVCEFDEQRLDQIYEGLLGQFSDLNVTYQVIIPLMQHLGRSWEKGDTGVAEEHFFSLYIRNKLGSRWHHGHYPGVGEKLVIACMPGERHEYGLLFFALLARARGFSPILLGADMPLKEISHVVNRTGAAGVVLCNTIVPGWQVIQRDLKDLCNAVKVPVFIGGAGTDQIETKLQAVGATPIGGELGEGVETIFETLRKG